MKELIKQSEVEYVAKLARIAISPEEIKKVQEQLERILEFVGQLRLKDTQGVPASSHPLDLSNVWREDVAKPFMDIPELLLNAPELEETFYKVKKVIE